MFFKTIIKAEKRLKILLREVHQPSAVPSKRVFSSVESSETEKYASSPWEDFPWDSRATCGNSLVPDICNEFFKFIPI